MPNETPAHVQKPYKLFQAAKFNLQRGKTSATKGQHLDVPALSVLKVDVSSFCQQVLHALHLPATIMHCVTHMPSTPGSQSNGTTLHQVNNVVHTKQKHGATNARISWNEHCRPTTHGKQHNTLPQSASRKERCRPITHGKQHNTLPQSASRKER